VSSYRLRFYAANNRSSVRLFAFGFAHEPFEASDVGDSEVAAFTARQCDEIAPSKVD
jgi:hypothetical protein